MDKWKKILLVFICAVILTGAFFALRAIFPSDKYKESLKPPEYVRLDGTYLRWKKSAYAIGYNVKVGEEIRYAVSNELRLKYGDNGKFVSVSAVSSYKKPSDYTAEFQIQFSPYILRTTDTVTYRFDKANFSRTEFNFSGVPVSIEAEDFSKYGYEFIYWYYYENGVKTILKNPTLFYKSVTLFAEVKAISYPLKFIAVPEMPLPNGLPETYTVDTLAGISQIKDTYCGYNMDGWRIGSAEGIFLESGAVITGELTLYPRISLINKGLTFEKCNGGYALISFESDEENLFVPEYYKGEKVIKVMRGAIDGTAAPNLKTVTFYGDIEFETLAVTAAPKLKNITFCKNFTAADGAIVVADDLSGEGEDVLEITVGGVPPETDVFIKGYLNENFNKRVNIYVGAKYYQSCLANYSQCSVFVLR